MTALVPGILRLRAAAPATPRTAVIFIMQGGGASHLETYDPKPNAPAEIRGQFRPIQTNVPGVQLCELLPRQAQRMDKLAIVRSITHHEASHIAVHLLETGYFLRSSANALRGEMPSIGSVVAKLREAPEGLPGWVSIPRPQAYSSPHYLGGRFNFFPVEGDPNDPAFAVANLTLSPMLTRDTVERRHALLGSFNENRSAGDASGFSEAMDGYQRQARELLTSQQARIAFDLDQEPSALRDQYGRSSFGQRLILARRLVEADIPFVFVRTFDWDDHEGLAGKIAPRCALFDQGISALIDDLHQRGLAEQVLIVAMGEFGRTPKINQMGGRDHWPGSNSAILSGGSYRMGQTIGSTDNQGARPRERPYAPQQVLGMMYRHLGIDPGMTFLDTTGRPRYILEERDPISEL